MANTIPQTIGLKKGHKHDDVRALKSFLQRFGYFTQEERALLQAAPSEPDDFDLVTAMALKKYQRFHGLVQTGEIDAATVQMMGEPRCGNPDFAEFATGSTKWDRTNLTYGFREFTADLPQNDIRNAVQQAFALWSSVTPLRFTEVPIANGPDITIRFVQGDHGDGSPFDGRGTPQRNVLAHAFYPPPNGGDIAGDAHFDDFETWSITLPRPFGTSEFVTVAAHEFGHSLG